MTDAQFEVLLAELRHNRALLDEILRRLEQLERAQPEAEAQHLGQPHADDRVGVDYFARVTGLAPMTIRQGKAGVKGVPRQSTRPQTWLKRDVDGFMREQAARLLPVRQKAIKLLDQSRRGRKKTTGK